MCSTLVGAVDSNPADPPGQLVEGNAMPLELLEREICEPSGQIAAAMCRWLLLVAAWDRRRGWAEWGCRSCAHWL
jgi:hypothetical protein